MTRITYQIIRHRGGWAYRVDDTLSETFPTHAGAWLAADHAAREQCDPGTTTVISYEHRNGRWNYERTGAKEQPQIQRRG
jgi:hypothetical protein